MDRIASCNDRYKIFHSYKRPCNQYTGRKPARTIDDSIGFIKKILSGYESGDCFYWAIVPKERQELAGTVCLFNINIADRKAELGYELLPEWQGKGFMQEALQAITMFGFRQLQLQAIEAELEERNLPSIRVLERCNFVLAGRSGDKTPMLTYRLSAPDAGSGFACKFLMNIL